LCGGIKRDLALLAFELGVAGGTNQKSLAMNFPSMPALAENVATDVAPQGE
jgi:hypothetical protein